MKLTCVPFVGLDESTQASCAYRSSYPHVLPPGAAGMLLMTVSALGVAESTSRGWASAELDRAKRHGFPVTLRAAPSPTMNAPPRSGINPLRTWVMLAPAGGSSLSSS